MKLVLCGSYEDFRRFKEILWSKDKPIENYRYIGLPRDLQGCSPHSNEIIKLGSFPRHPRHTEICDMALARGFNLNTRAPRRNRPSFQEGGIVEAGSLSGTFQHVDGRVWDSSGIRIDPLQTLDLQSVVSAVDVTTIRDQEWTRELLGEWNGWDASED